MKQSDLVRRLIWTYFVLLIFEGALRKWILPGWSTVLLVVRDPIVVAIYLLAAKQFPWRSRLVPVSIVLAALCLLTSVAGEHFTPFVAAYGLRVNFLHLPLIFVIPYYMDREHVVHMGKWAMIFSLLIVWMMSRQFDGSIESPWNVGAGGTLGGQLKAGVGDKARASGPFAFITGPVLFFPIVAAFIFNALTYRKQVGMVLLVLATAGALLAIPVSISRSLLMGMIVTTTCYFIVIFSKPRLFKGGMKAAILLLIVLLIVGATQLFQDSSTYLGFRWRSATTESGGFFVAIVGRLLSEVTISLDLLLNIPLFGLGIGVGTNVGSYILTGEHAFLLSEGEWGRIVLESGPILGLAFIMVRVSIGYILLIRSLQSLRRGDVLPVLLWSACVLNIVTGQWGPPTSMGFAALGGGLILAACRPARGSKSLVSRASGEESERSPSGESSIHPITA
jgi:hypothetical protein